MLGALRYNLARPHFDQNSLVTYIDQQESVIIDGGVVAEPDARDAETSSRKFTTGRVLQAVLQSLV